MRVLIYEPDYAGHHLTYLRLLLPQVAMLVESVVVALPAKAAESEEFSTQLARVPSNVSFDLSLRCVPVTPVRGARWRVKELGSTARRHHPDHVYLPYADGITQVAGFCHALRRNPIPDTTEVEGLLMRGRFAYPPPEGLSYWRSAAVLAALSLAPLSVVHHLDPLAYEFAMRRGGSLAKRSRLMPDPVGPLPSLDQSVARQQLAIPQDGRYIGCAGLMAEHKGIDLLLNAFAAARLGRCDRLLLVGTTTARIRELIDCRFGRLVRAGRIVVIDRYVTDAELAAAIVAVDVVCTPYPSHIGSASIVIRAAAAGRPVLAQRFGWMGRIVPQMGLGGVCEVRDSATFTSAIERAIPAAAEYRQPEIARRFVRFHSPENFAVAWTARLRERLGLTPTESMHHQWARVLAG